MKSKEIDKDQNSSFLIAKIEEVLDRIEKMKLAEYIDFMNSPKRTFKFNFLSGIARGFGGVIGATVFVALLIYLLNYFNTLNIPVLGRYIADIVRIVENYLH